MKFLSFFGHLNIDIILSVSRLPLPGEAAEVKSISENFAGTAGNFALVLNKLGVNFDLYSGISGETHKEFLEFLRQRYISTNYIKIFNGEKGPICYLTTDGNEQIAYMYQGPVYTKWKPSEYFEDDNYEYIHFGTGPADEYIKIAERNKKSKIVFDPGQETWYMYDKNKAMKLIKKAHMIIINYNEFQYLLKMINLGETDLLNYVQYIVVTKGSSGAILYSHNGEEKFPAYNSSSINDTIGAGDSFRAGFYFGIYNHYSIQDSVRLGNLVASYAIQRPIKDFSIDKNFLTGSLEKIKL